MQESEEVRFESEPAIESIHKECFKTICCFGLLPEVDFADTGVRVNIILLISSGEVVIPELYSFGVELSSLAYLSLFKLHLK
jgi:hypothetical protein